MDEAAHAAAAGLAERYMSADSLAERALCVAIGMRAEEIRAEHLSLVLGGGDDA